MTPKEIRQRLRIPQRVLAKILGVSPSTIAQWERRNVDIRSSNYLKLQKILDEMADFLVNSTIQQKLKKFGLQIKLETISNIASVSDSFATKTITQQKQKILS